MLFMANRTIIEGLPGIAVEVLDPIPPNANPFHHDRYHMGGNIGTNVMMMNGQHKSEYCHYIILVNRETGARIRIEFNNGEAENENNGQVAANHANFIDMLIKNPELYGG